MIIRAIANSGAALPPSCRNRSTRFERDTSFRLTVGRDYLVYGVTSDSEMTWYYIIDDDEHRWPIWHPAPLFEIVDGRLPPSWTFGHHKYSEETYGPCLSFPEWADDSYFYEHLLDDRPRELDIFEKRRDEAERFHAPEYQFGGWRTSSLSVAGGKGTETTEQVMLAGIAGETIERVTFGPEISLRTNADSRLKLNGPLNIKGRNGAEVVVAPYQTEGVSELLELVLQVRIEDVSFNTKRDLLVLFENGARMLVPARKGQVTWILDREKTKIF